MVTIEKMMTAHIGDVINLRVSNEQLPYVGSIYDILKISNAQIRSHIVKVDATIVGFFLIDTVYSSHHEFAVTNSLGLRKFFIDHRYQGKGYAKQTLQQLPSFLLSVYPEAVDLYLTVNCKNSVAKDCYLKNGFEDTNELYHGGPSGPQQILRKILK